MNIAQVMQEISDRIDTIAGLRCFAYPPGTVTPPAAVVSYPTSIEFDETYGRGVDAMSLPVVVAVGRPTDRTTRDLLTAYCAGAGASSIKEVVESGTYTALDNVRVESVEFDVIALGGVDYMAAMFTLDIGGSGT